MTVAATGQDQQKMTKEGINGGGCWSGGWQSFVIGRLEKGREETGQPLGMKASMATNVGLTATNVDSP